MSEAGKSKICRRHIVLRIITIENMSKVTDAVRLNNLKLVRKVVVDDFQGPFVPPTLMGPAIPFFGEGGIWQLF